MLCIRVFFTNAFYYVIKISVTDYKKSTWVYSTDIYTQTLTRMYQNIMLYHAVQPYV